MKTLKKYLLGFILLGLVAAAAVMIYIKTHPKPLPPNLIMGVGTILADETYLNTKYPGRLKLLKVDEGDNVRKGELLARLDSPEFEAKKESVEQMILAKKEELKAKKVELGIAQASVPQNVQKALADKKAKESMLAELANQIEALQDVVRQDAKDYKRLKKLYTQHLVPKHKVEEMALKLATDRKKLDALLAKKRQVLAAIEAAKSTIAQAQAQLQKTKALRYAIDALKNEILALVAQKKQIEAMIHELSLYAPYDGYVTQKIANVGEVIGAGMGVVALVDPKEFYLQIFVDTLQNGRIKIGDKAEIFLDAYPDRPIPALVSRIAQKAEFTPKEVAVRSDRIQKVYAVRLKPVRPNPLLKLGLPAIGIITTNGKGLPRSLDEVPPL